MLDHPILTPLLKSRSDVTKLFNILHLLSFAMIYMAEYIFVVLGILSFLLFARLLFAVFGFLIFGSYFWGFPNSCCTTFAFVSVFSVREYISIRKFYGFS